MQLIQNALYCTVKILNVFEVPVRTELMFICFSSVQNTFMETVYLISVHSWIYCDENPSSLFLSLYWKNLPLGKVREMVVRVICVFYP